MCPPRTAKDDHPGPIGRRHNSTGGDLAQSVSIVTPRTMLSRAGPRKPGHSAPVGAFAATGGGADGVPASRFSVTARGEEADTGEPSPARAAGDSTGVVAAGG